MAFKVCVVFNLCIIELMFEVGLYFPLFQFSYFPDEQFKKNIYRSLCQHAWYLYPVHKAQRGARVVHLHLRQSFPAHFWTICWGLLGAGELFLQLFNENDPRSDFLDLERCVEVTRGSVGNDVAGSTRHIGILSNVDLPWWLVYGLASSVL